MTSTDILRKVQTKLSNDFNNQNIEEGFFDVLFEINEKKLYAHKCVLSAVSKPFTVMFSERWITKDDPIKLTNYSYEDYKELMKFIYSGSCSLNQKNMFLIVDLAELYDVIDLKNYCDGYLAKQNLDASNIFLRVELARQYSLAKLDEALKLYIAQHYCTLLESNEYIQSKKSIIEAFVDYTEALGESECEKCFNRTLEWAEKQAIGKNDVTNDENFDLQKAIKNELSGISSRFMFSKMSQSFLIRSVAKKSFLFSGDELSNILLTSRTINIMIMNSSCQTLIGNIPYDQEIYDAISQLNNTMSNTTYYSSYDSWSRQLKMPAKSICLKKNNQSKFVLVYNGGKISLLSSSRLNNSFYLIAEMNGEGFNISGSMMKMLVYLNF